MGGAGKVGIGGGREKVGWFELPAESVLGGGLLEFKSFFCILSGLMVGVCAVSEGRRKSSSSGLPCLRPSIAGIILGSRFDLGCWIGRGDRRRLIFGDGCRSTDGCASETSPWVKWVAPKAVRGVAI